MRDAGGLLALFFLVGCSGPPADAPPAPAEALSRTAVERVAPAQVVAPRIVVHTTGACRREGIPVLVDGREVARTDGGGVARAFVPGTVGSTVEVRLATSPDPSPVDPAAAVVLGEGEVVVHFGETDHCGALAALEPSPYFCGLAAGAR